MYGGRGLNSEEPNATLIWNDLWLFDSHLDPPWQRKVSPPQDTSLEDTNNSSVVSGRELASICGLTDKGFIVVFGGRTSERNPSNDLLLLATEPHWHWEVQSCVSDTGECPPARYDALSWCDERHSRMRIIGGYGIDDCHLADSWELDLHTLTWTRIPTPATGCASISSPSSDECNLGCSMDDDCNETFTPLKMALVWQTTSGDVYLMCDNETTSCSSPNIQMWMWQMPDISNVTISKWTLIEESGHSATMWPGTHRHGGTCADDHGRLWLFGGQSQIGDHKYLNNDVWSFDIFQQTWMKTELPSDGSSLEPQQRHLAVSWCYHDSMYVYGGLTCVDHFLPTCIRGDLWRLNISVASSPTVSGSSSSKFMTGDMLAVSAELLTNVTEPPPSSTSIDGIAEVRLTVDAVGVLVHNSQVLVNQPDRQEIQEGISTTTDHGAYGSAIFFGISLSVFTLFGLILFFRRCVSCPPRDNILLKEPPPVRYTVIPDESYTI